MSWIGAENHMPHKNVEAKVDYDTCTLQNFYTYENRACG